MNLDFLPPDCFLECRQGLLSFVNLMFTVKSLVVGIHLMMHHCNCEHTTFFTHQTMHKVHENSLVLFRNFSHHIEHEIVVSHSWCQRDFVHLVPNVFKLGDPSTKIICHTLESWVLKLLPQRKPWWCWLRSIFFNQAHPSQMTISFGIFYGLTVLDKLKGIFSKGIKWLSFLTFLLLTNELLTVW